VPHAVQSEAMKQFKDAEQIVPSYFGGFKLAINLTEL